MATSSNRVTPDLACDDPPDRPPTLTMEQLQELLAKAAQDKSAEVLLDMDGGNQCKTEPA